MTPDPDMQRVVALLRDARDLMPKSDAVMVQCGNLSCRGGYGHPDCGQPAKVWADAAWQIEYLARNLEAAS